MERLCTAGEDALMLYLGEHADEHTLARARSAVAALERELGDLLIDLVPSYASVLILFDPLHSSHHDMRRRVRRALASLDAHTAAPAREVVLPVYYAPETGPDLEALALRAHLSIEQVIALHAGVEYRVYAIGFAPGFAYLGQVDERIATPRLASPRARVPPGSVAIADRQTAVYPSASPGGWNLIGRCPVPMFDRSAPAAMPVGVGDSVRFEPISREQFLALGGSLD